MHLSQSVLHSFFNSSPTLSIFPPGFRGSASPLGSFRWLIARYKKPKKQRQIERAERLTREAFEAKEAVASVHRQRQRQLKVERRAERQAQRRAAAAAGSNAGAGALGSLDLCGILFFGFS